MRVKHSVILKSILLACFTIVCLFCFARAGGSSSTGMGFWKILIFIFLLPFILIYAAIRSFYLSNRKNKANRLIEKLAQNDGAWAQRDMTAKAEETFLIVQKAWVERNLDIAKDHITPRLYTKYKFQTDDMTARGVKNILQDIKVEKIDIFSVGDYKDDARDTFSARISGTMLDYEVDEATGAVIKGDRDKTHYFEDIWVFIRQQNAWVADDVDNDVTIEDIRKGQASSEG